MPYNGFGGISLYLEYTCLYPWAETGGGLLRRLKIVFPIKLFYILFTDSHVQGIEFKGDNMAGK